MEDKVESFTLDHDKVKAPFVRKCKELTTKHGDKVSKFDIRFTQPNKLFMKGAGMHSLEHLIAFEFAETSPWVSIDSSCMACKTGVYWSMLGSPSEPEMTDYLISAFRRIVDKYDGKTNADIPGATRKQCGNYRYHDLAAAIGYLKHFLAEVRCGYYVDPQRTLFPEE